MAGLYIHIPFCESRCIYCGFYSTTSLALRDSYTAALCQEMQLRKDCLQEPISTVYLGGGTPSQLSSQQLQKIFQSVGLLVSQCETNSARPRDFQSPNVRQTDSPVWSGKEVTIECNPDDVTEEFASQLAQLPVNRVSMGAQTFSDERLRFLHRRHTAEEVRLAVVRLRKAGIRNISIDLMFGFPGERLADWEQDIRQALDLQVEHISAYSLMIEEGTPLHRLVQQGKIQEIDEELSLQMYNRLIDLLTEAGYEHYEISNFARPGYRSRHNSSYWQEVPYLGIGAAAHSYTRQQQADGSLLCTRSWNVADIRQYIQAISEGRLPSESETLDLKTRYNDLITTALRTCDGINLDKMQKEFGDSLFQEMMKEAAAKIKNGLMKIDHQHLSLTRRGLFISDDIMSDFIQL